MSSPLPRGRSRVTRWLAALGLVGLLLGCQAATEQASGTAPTSAKQEPLSPAAQAGRQLFVAKGCGACHRAPGIAEAQGTIGTNLRGIGNPAEHPRIAGVLDNTPENMQRWLTNPTEVKPGTAMPNLSLTQDEVAKLTALLETFK